MRAANTDTGPPACIRHIYTPRRSERLRPALQQTGRGRLTTAALGPPRPAAARSPADGGTRSQASSPGTTRPPASAARPGSTSCGSPRPRPAGPAAPARPAGSSAASGNSNGPAGQIRTTGEKNGGKMGRVVLAGVAGHLQSSPLVWGTHHQASRTSYRGAWKGASGQAAWHTGRSGERWLSPHQNHLEGSIEQVTGPCSPSLIPPGEWGLMICISNRFSGAAASSGAHTLRIRSETSSVLLQPLAVSGAAAG